MTAALAGATTAEAAGSYISSNSGGANIRSCASTTCGSYGYLSNGTGVSMQCRLDSQWVYPPSSNYASNRWRLHVREGGGAGRDRPRRSPVRPVLRHWQA
ncbi:hypothetical protein [Streptomyces sp. NPDC048603]|uniref:hypothetical protein n=1 Tax=Streptomyces sp. NPDC048603 TaxID=3365577 RepID=UPI0037112713